MSIVTVIIPLYNKGALVKRSINSILNQTFQDFEIIIIDDGSTDDGPEYVKRYKDTRIRLIQQPNMGPGAARNRGVKEATSKYVAFLDADDEFCPEYLQKSITNLLNNTDCVLSVVNHYRGDDKILATQIPPWNIGIETGPWRLSPDDDIKVMWGSFLYLQTWAVTCRRDIIERFGGFYEHRCTYAEDQYLWLQIILNCKIYRDLTPLHWYHTEDSELLWNRKSHFTMFPYLSDPEPVRKNCPSEYRKILEKIFAYTAASDFPTMTWQYDTKSIKYLLGEFPGLKNYRKDWRLLLFKLQIKIAFPWLLSPVRLIKRIISA